MVASAALPAAASFAAFFAASWLHVVTKGVPPGFLGVSCPSMNSSAQAYAASSPLSVVSGFLRFAFGTFKKKQFTR